MFISQEHKNNYNELLKRDSTHSGDNERKALFYILSGFEDLFNKVDAIYNFREHNIELDYSSKRDFCSSSKKLIELAFNLYNSYPTNLTVIDIFAGLDQQNFKLALNAIRLRFNQ